MIELLHMQKIALASASPRRRELLAQLGVQFELVKADVDETQRAGEVATDYVLRLAISKAQAGLTAQVALKAQAGLKASESLDVLPVLGADTIVVVDGEVLGKPADQAAAVSFLLSPEARFICGSVLFVDGGHDAVFRPDQV